MWREDLDFRIHQIWLHNFLLGECCSDKITKIKFSVFLSTKMIHFSWINHGSCLSKSILVITNDHCSFEITVFYVLCSESFKQIKRVMANGNNRQRLNKIAECRMLIAINLSPTQNVVLGNSRMEKWMRQSIYLHVEMWADRQYRNNAREKQTTEFDCENIADLGYSRRQCLVQYIFDTEHVRILHLPLHDVRLTCLPPSTPRTYPINTHAKLNINLCDKRRQPIH